MINIMKNSTMVIFIIKTLGPFQLQSSGAISGLDLVEFASRVASPTLPDREADWLANFHLIKLFNRLNISAVNYQCLNELCNFQPIGLKFLNYPEEGRLNLSRFQFAAAVLWVRCRERRAKSNRASRRISLPAVPSACSLSNVFASRSTDTGFEIVGSHYLNWPITIVIYL